MFLDLAEVARRTSGAGRRELVITCEPLPRWGYTLQILGSRTPDLA